MTALPATTEEESALIDGLVAHYKDNEYSRAERLADALLRLATDRRLRPLVHSLKMRAKDPEHLRDKLHRKLGKCKREGSPFDVTPENLFAKINDLAGV